MQMQTWLARKWRDWLQRGRERENTEMPIGDEVKKRERGSQGKQEVSMANIHLQSVSVQSSEGTFQTFRDTPHNSVLAIVQTGEEFTISAIVANPNSKPC